MSELPEQLQDKWTSQKDAMAYLRMSRSAFFRQRRMGVFECRKFKGEVIVLKSDIDRFLNSLPVA